MCSAPARDITLYEPAKRLSLNFLSLSLVPLLVSLITSLYTSSCETILVGPVPLPETGIYTWMSKITPISDKDFLLSRAIKDTERF